MRSYEQITLLFRAQSITSNNHFLKKLLALSTILLHHNRHNRALRLARHPGAIPSLNRLLLEHTILLCSPIGKEKAFNGVGWLSRSKRHEAKFHLCDVRELINRFFNGISVSVAIRPNQTGDKNPSSS